MAQQVTYKQNVIVLRKRDLGESDLVLSLLAEDGSRIEAVAKGARKPQSAQSTRLELFSCAEVHFARGKSLDIAKESRVVTSYQAIRDDFDKTACASVMAEAADKTLVVGTQILKLYPMFQAALNALSTCDSQTSPAIVAGYLLKLFAFLGIRPNLTSCVHCGGAIDLSTSGFQRISFEDGGALCNACRTASDAVSVKSATLGWSEALLMSSFADIEGQRVHARTSFDVLQFCQQWMRVHLGITLKSLNYLFAYATFDDTEENTENACRE